MSDPAPETLVFRPHRLRLTVNFFSLLLCALSAAGWVLLPADLQATFTTSQRVTLLLILAALVFLMQTVAFSTVRADANGLRIRNGLRVHEIGWDQVHKILLRRGDPWAIVLIKPSDRPFEVDLDAEKRQLMGIQAGDRATAEAAIAALRAKHQAYRTAAR